MGYCSFSEDSNVSVSRDAKVPRAIVCSWCKLQGGAYDWIALSEEEMIGHLLEHRRKGHKVPEDAIEKLRKENKL